MSGHIKFNVIVPTRERADTLHFCLRTLIAQEYPNFRIIVSDNFSQDNTREVVADFADQRIEYINTGKRLSMSHNWEFALSHVTDGWVMFIGDDDGLYPWALSELNTQIQAAKVQAVSSKCGIFIWPGQYEWQGDGSLTVPLTYGVEIKQSRNELEKVFAGKQRYGELPWLYNGGAASIELINKLRDNEGKFFRSQIPDIYSAIALSSATDRFLSVKTPIAINGASRHSTGSANMHSSSGKGDKSVLQFHSEDNIPFHHSLLLGKSLQVMIYESYLQSWHIHHGKMGIDLAEQLLIAMKVAPAAHLHDIEQECKAIAIKNGVSFDPGNQAKPEKISPFSSASMTRARLVSNTGKLGIATIDDAAIASARIYAQMTKKIFGIRVHLRWYFFKQRLRMISPRLFRAFERIGASISRNSTGSKG